MSNYHTSLTAPLSGPVTMTASDTVDLERTTRQIRVLTSGNLAVLWIDGQETVEAVEAGDVWDWRIRRLKTTGTTATCKGYY